MGLVYRILIAVAQILKPICPILALIYMICWGFLIGNPEMFAKWNPIFGAFPDLLNDIFQFQSDIDGQDIDMGYVLGAAFLFVFMFSLIQLQNFLEYRLILFREQVVERVKENLKIQKVISQMEDKVEEFVKLNQFWGLLELEIDKSDIYDLNVDIEKIKLQCNNTMIKKLQERYSEIKSTKNKIYFHFSTFEEFQNSIVDIVKLARILKDVVAKKGFSLNFILSYFSSSNPEQNKMAFSTLEKINNLKMRNKVVVSKDIRNFCFKKNLYDFLSLGESLLFAQNSNEQDVSIDLYQLKIKINA